MGDRLGSLATRRRSARDTDGIELLALETRYDELAGWFAQDIGDERTATPRKHWTLPTSPATPISPRTSSAVRHSWLSTPVILPTLSASPQPPRRTTRPGSRLEVIAVPHEAHARAVLGEGSEAHRVYDTALILLGRAGSDGVWGSWLDAAYISTARARSLAALGEYAQAAAGFDSALALLPPTYRRDRGV
ncbi:hypothetical protein [Streptomyces sp. NPDC088719]|uniref:hypothetical protein n=1 Tax=Streptomyces sp. NPDC088719 TaxID=3365872 RepID=UPI0037F2FDFA